MILNKIEVLKYTLDQEGSFVIHLLDDNGKLTCMNEQDAFYIAEIRITCKQCIKVAGGKKDPVLYSYTLKNLVQ
ncbi:MAG: hypothetical protein HeimC2_30230 [Candidatus Heimdallarchaeota archaeon LC_2]|nr:MAG: hypothetical protein HeimC2_30230 [Candidatus Heimdallarchaeota archaeon LC_2]